MSNTFRLIDLVSQASAVEELLRDKSVEEKIEWLSSHGSITPKPKSVPEERQTFFFETPTGCSCAFFFDGNELVFVGDHTTFTARQFRNNS